MTEQVSATELFRAAYENRYTWDKSFPGYTADVVLTQGSEKFTGTIQVNPNLSATVNGIDNVEANKSIEGQLREVAIHRIRRTFEETHSKNTFEYGDTDETGAARPAATSTSSATTKFASFTVRFTALWSPSTPLAAMILALATFPTATIPSMQIRQPAKPRVVNPFSPIATSKLAVTSSSASAASKPKMAAKRQFLPSATCKPCPSLFRQRPPQSKLPLG
jgi:Protein of unknown function (DUF3386)